MLVEAVPKRLQRHAGRFACPPPLRNLCLQREVALVRQEGTLPRQS